MFFYTLKTSIRLVLIHILIFGNSHARYITPVTYDYTVGSLNDLASSAAQPRPVFVDLVKQPLALPLVAPEAPVSAKSDAPISDASVRVEKILRRPMSFSYNTDQDTQASGKIVNSPRERLKSFESRTDQQPDAIDYYKYIARLEDEEKSGGGDAKDAEQAKGEKTEQTANYHEKQSDAAQGDSKETKQDIRVSSRPKISNGPNILLDYGSSHFNEQKHAALRDHNPLRPTGFHKHIAKSEEAEETKEKHGGHKSQGVDIPLDHHEARPVVHISEPTHESESKKDEHHHEESHGHQSHADHTDHQSHGDHSGHHSHADHADRADHDDHASHESHAEASHESHGEGGGGNDHSHASSSHSEHKHEEAKEEAKEDGHASATHAGHGGGGGGGGGGHGGNFKKGGAREHHADHYSEHKQIGEKAYHGDHHHEKGEKGHHDKDGHDDLYTEGGGDKESQHGEDGYHHEHEHGEEGKKGADFHEEGEHSKGHSTQGEHNIHKKDEYEKKQEFYDESHEGGEHEKHGEYFHGDDYKKGGHEKSGHKGGKHHEDHYGKKEQSEHGGHHHEDAGHDEAEGHDSHHDHHEKGGKHIGKDGEKKWHYKEGHGDGGGGGHGDSEGHGSKAEAHVEKAATDGKAAETKNEEHKEHAALDHEHAASDHGQDNKGYAGHQEGHDSHGNKASYEEHAGFGSHGHNNENQETDKVSGEADAEGHETEGHGFHAAPSHAKQNAGHHEEKDRPLYAAASHAGYTAEHVGNRELHATPSYGGHSTGSQGAESRQLHTAGDNSEYNSNHHSAEGYGLQAEASHAGQGVGDHQESHTFRTRKDGHSDDGLHGSASLAQHEGYGKGHAHGKKGHVHKGVENKEDDYRQADESHAAHTHICPIAAKNSEGHQHTQASEDYAHAQGGADGGKHRYMLVIIDDKANGKDHLAAEESNYEGIK